MFRLLLILVLSLSAPVWAERCHDPSLLSIEQVQGAAEVSPYNTKTVTVSGIVTAVFQGSNELNGFFIQGRDVSPQKSHGLFIYASSKVSPGEHIVVKGQVKEYYGLTELTNVKVLERCGKQKRPDAIELPASVPDVEREAFEGVLVRLPEARIRSNQALLRYGQMMLSSATDSNGKNGLWLVDDPSTETFPKRLEYLSNVSDITQLHVGQTIQPFEAIVSFGFGEFRLIPVQPLRGQAAGNDTVHGLPSAQSDLRLAAINVKNLFNGNGRGGRFLNNRGAENQAQYQQQLAWLSKAIITLDADILVLNEVENDGFGKWSTVGDLLASPGAEDYEAVRFTEAQRGGAAIHNVLLYRPGSVTPIGVPESIIDWDGWIDRWHRPFLMQRFKLRDRETELAVIAAHLKSKGGRCPSDSEKIDERIGACSYERKQAVDTLNDWLLADRDLPTVLLGDLNSYPDEAPIQALLNDNWRPSAPLESAYSYIYKGVPDVLDYALVRNISMQQVINSGYWNINSGALAVNAVKTLPWPLKALSLPEIAGFSDHDPVWLDLSW